MPRRMHKERKGRKKGGTEGGGGEVGPERKEQARHMPAEGAK